MIAARGIRAAAAGALAAAVVLLSAAPAAAAPPTGTFTSPDEGAVVADGAPTIRGEFRHGGRVDKVVLTVTSLRGHPGASVELPGDGTGLLAFSWTPGLAYNGPYAVRAEGTASERPVDANGPESASISRSFTLEVPPAPPADVKATLVSKDTRYVRIAWKAGPEPDLVGYQVQRAHEDDPYASVGEVTGTSFTDRETAKAGGTYRYRVVSIRRGGSDDALVASGFSATSAAEVPSPPAPPTTKPTTTTTVDATPGEDPDRTIEKKGRIDLSAFGSLQAKKKSSKPGEPDRRPPVDNSPFDEALPFDVPEREIEEEYSYLEEVGGVDSPVVGRGAPSGDRTGDLVKVALGMLSFAVAAHGAFILREARFASAALEPLAPASLADAPAGDAGPGGPPVKAMPAGVRPAGPGLWAPLDPSRSATPEAPEGRMATAGDDAGGGRTRARRAPRRVPQKP